MTSLNFAHPKQEAPGSQLHPANSRAPQRVRMSVTPELAREWLKKNVQNNRPLRDSFVIKYGLDMLEGRWQYNGDAIRFDSADRLIDGQHRLHACIEARIPFETDVIFGLAPESIRTIDIGKSRTAGNIAHFEGAQNASCACAVAGLILLHRRHGIQCLNDARCQPTKTQIVEAARTLAGLDAAVTQARLLGKKIAPPRIVGFCYYQFAAQNRDLAQRFFEDYYRENRPLRKLFWKTDGPSPEKFPDIGEAA